MGGDFRRPRHRHHADRSPDAGEVFAREPRKDRRDATRGVVAEQVRHAVYAALLTGGHHHAAAAEAEVQSILEVAPRLTNEIPAGHAGIGGAIGDEFGNVLRADEDSLELAAEGGGERAVTPPARVEAGVGEQVARLVGQPALVGKSDLEHGSAGSGSTEMKKARPDVRTGRSAKRPLGEGAA